MVNLFKKARGTISNYVGSVSGDANQITNTLISKFGSMESISNTFDQRISDGLTDLLTGATGIRTSNIPEISDKIMQAKSANREARNAVLNNVMGGRLGMYDSPTQGIKLKYPENFTREDGESGEMTNYIHFRSLPRRSTGEHDGEEQLYDIFLYVPNTLADSIDVEYGSAEKGLVEGAVASLFSDGPIKNQFADKGEMWNIIKAGAPGSDIIKASTGKTVNPLKFQLFKGVGMRTYSYNFEFRPINKNDSKTIQEITYAFRKSMLPGTEGDHSRIYTFPNEWAIRYHGQIRQWVDYPMVTVCNKADVNWAPNGFVQHLDGAPTAITLGLSFTELVTLDRKKYDDRVSGFKHGMDRERENSQERGSIEDINTANAAAERAKAAALELEREAAAENAEAERLANLGAGGGD